MFIKNSVNLFESDSPRRSDSNPQVCACVYVRVYSQTNCARKQSNEINNNNGRNSSKKNLYRPALKRFLTFTGCLHQLLFILYLIWSILFSFFSPMLFLSSKWMRSRDFSKILNVILSIFSLLSFWLLHSHSFVLLFLALAHALPTSIPGSVVSFRVYGWGCEKFFIYNLFILLMHDALAVPFSRLLCASKRHRMNNNETKNQTNFFLFLFVHRNDCSRLAQNTHRDTQQRNK